MATKIFAETETDPNHLLPNKSSNKINNNNTKVKLNHKNELIVTKKNDKEIKLPKYHETYLHLMSGSWLNINDDEEEGAFNQFLNGNVNLSLICALLLTTFLPLMYNEPQRLDISDDGLTIDIFSGYINSLHPIILSKDQIHDWFDTTYLISVAGTLFGTMVSVFYMLAVNEAADDARTMVFMHSLGRYVSNVPFYFFSIGIIAWGIGAWFQSVLVPRSATGFWIKQISLFSMTVIMFLFCFPRMIIGAYLSKIEKISNTPILLTTEEIESKLTSFLIDYEHNDVSLHEFLRSLQRITKHKYRIPLHEITKLRATKCYFEKVGNILHIEIDELKELHDLSSS